MLGAILNERGTALMNQSDDEGVLSDTTEYIDVNVGLTEMVLADGRSILEEDYRVKGEVWRVHKGDADESV